MLVHKLYFLDTHFIVNASTYRFSTEGFFLKATVVWGNEARSARKLTIKTSTHKQLTDDK
jgi:hypothetical protein